MKTLSQVASEFVAIELPCGDCGGTGQLPAIKTNVISFFSPHEYVEQACESCGGRGVRETEVCPLCREEEGICVRACRRAPCCGQHPVECDCPRGVELYQDTYGLPRAA